MSMLKVTAKNVKIGEMAKIIEKSKENLKLDSKYFYGVSESNVVIPEGVNKHIKIVQSNGDRHEGYGTVGTEIDENTLMSNRRLKAHKISVEKLINVLNVETGTEWAVKQVVCLFAPFKLFVLLCNGQKEVVYRSINSMSNGTGLTRVFGQNGSITAANAFVSTADIISAKENDIKSAKRHIELSQEAIKIAEEENNEERKAQLEYYIKELEGEIIKSLQYLDEVNAKKEFGLAPVLEIL